MNIPESSPLPPYDAAQDHSVWVRNRKLEQQRERRASMRRIDYYPSQEAAEAIDALCGPYAGGDYSSVINALILGTD